MATKENIKKLYDGFSNLCAALRTAAVVFNKFVLTLVFDPTIFVRTQEIKFSLVGG